MSIDLTALEDALRAAAKDAAPKALALARSGLDEAQAVGGEAARLAEGTARDMAAMLAAAQAGHVDADVAAESVDRYLSALEELRGAAAEGAARVGIEKARRYLSLAADVGFALARAGIAAAAAGL